MFGQDKTVADDQLTKDFKDCPSSHVKQHLPFDYDDRNAVTDDRNAETDVSKLKTLCQDGYIIRYSTERRTPLFTAQRMNGAVRKAAIASVSTKLDF